MNQYKKLGNNIALLTIGNFASKLLIFFLVPFYTSVLTPAEYGITDLITNTASLVGPIFTLLIGEAVMRYSLDSSYDKRQIFTIGLVTVFCGFIIMALILTLMLFSQLSQIIESYYLIFTVYYFVIQINYLLSQFAKGLEEVKIFTLSGVLNTVFLIVFSLLFLLLLKLSITGYLLAIILSSVLTNLFLFFGAKMNNYIVTPKKINRKMLKEMFGYSIPLIPNSISWWFSNFSDRYILLFFSGAAAVGVYSVSYKVSSILAVIATIFLGAWQISSVEDFGSEKNKQFHNNIYNSYSSINIIIATLLILLIKPIANVIFLNEFYVAWKISPILIFAVMFYAMGGFLGTIYTSAKRTMMILFTTLIAAIVNLILNIVLIPYLSGTGAAIATLISYFSLWLFRLINSRKILQLTVKLKKDCFCYSLLLIQTIFVCIDDKISLFCSIFISIVILMVEFRFIKEYYYKIIKHNDQYGK